jgi:osmotically-inducible protein OsmY
VNAREVGDAATKCSVRQGSGLADVGASSEPSLRGRGPKGYTRSDERLLEAICESLTEDPRIDASDISVEVSNGAASLAGTVTDKRTKWLVEDIVESISGVNRVDNRLRCAQASRAPL